MLRHPTKGEAVNYAKAKSWLLEIVDDGNWIIGSLKVGSFTKIEDNNKKI